MSKKRKFKKVRPLGKDDNLADFMERRRQQHEKDGYPLGIRLSELPPDMLQPVQEREARHIAIHGRSDPHLARRIHAHHYHRMAGLHDYNYTNTL